MKSPGRKALAALAFLTGLGTAGAASAQAVSPGLAASAELFLAEDAISGPPKKLSPEDAVAFTAVEKWFKQKFSAADSAVKSGNEDDTWSALIDEWQAASAARTEDNAHRDEVTRALAAWKPALFKAWRVCEKRVSRDASPTSRFEPLFQETCTGVAAQYDMARNAVAYVLAQREAAADLAVIGKAGVGQ
jgi:hypothetical protein